MPMETKNGTSTANYTEQMGLPLNVPMDTNHGGSTANYTERMATPLNVPMDTNHGGSMANDTERNGKIKLAHNPVQVKSSPLTVVNIA